MGLLIAAFVLLAMFAGGDDAIDEGGSEGAEWSTSFQDWDVSVWRDHGQWKWQATPPQTAEWSSIANLFANSDSRLEARAEAVLNVMLKIEQVTGRTPWWIFVDSAGEGFGPDGWGVLVDTIMEGEAFGDPRTVIAVANMKVDDTITRAIGGGLTGTLKRVS